MDDGGIQNDHRKYIEISFLGSRSSAQSFVTQLEAGHVM